MELIRQIFDDEMIASSIKVAMAIETGEADYDYIIEQIEADPIGGRMLILFLSRFNDMTRNALDLLYTHAARKHLEKCYKES